MKQFQIFSMVFLGLGSGLLEAQTITVPFTFSGTSPVILQMDTYGDFSAVGTYGTGTFSLSGAGTRMFWNPAKAAFRAGYVSGIQWDASNVGSYSVGFGNSSTASGFNSSAFSGGTASGTGSTAINGGTASGPGAVAIGGNLPTASGAYSTAFGTTTLASGTGSTSFGTNVTASGIYATAFGLNTIGGAYDSFVIGQYNVGAGTAGSWVPTEPLLEVGNGTSSSARADALVIYKNGNAVFSNAVTAAAGGDIPMYTGN